MSRRQDKITEVVEQLESISRGVRKNNPRIRPWVSEYLRECLYGNKEVVIFTPCCIGTDLVRRYEAQGNRFIPNEAEKRLFRKEIPRIIRILKEAGLKMEWYYSFNQAFQDVWRIKDQLKYKYEDMIRSLAKDTELITEDSVNLLRKYLEFIDWEEDVLEERPKPNPLVFSEFEEYVKPGMIEREFEDLLQWTIDEKIEQTEEQVRKDLKLDISCAAGEGKLLMSGKTVLGSKFIFMTIERPEALDALALLVPELKERIVTSLNIYPARLSFEEKKNLGME